MTDLRVWLALACLLALAGVFASHGVKWALAPLCAVGTAVLWLAFAGTLGFLQVGGWLLYAAGAGGVGYLAVRHLALKKPLPAPDFGFWFFAVASAAGILLLWRSQPMFTTWDEFSLWGTGAKLTKLYDQLYTTAPVGWPWTATQTPALFVLEYFFQLFGGDFVEWQVYAAADVLQFSALAAVLAPFGRFKRDWAAALPAALAGLLVPYLFSMYRTATQITRVYMDSLGDIPMGLVFGAALACWFFAGGRRLRDMAPVCIALGTLALVKEIGFSLALVAAVLILADWLAAGRRPGLSRRQWAAGGLARFGLAAAAPLAAWAGWGAYIAGLTGVERTESLGGAYEIGMLEMPAAFLKELLSPDKSELFTTVTRGMARAFIEYRTTMLGTGLMVSAGIAALIALAALLAPNAGLRRQCWVFGVFSALGFIPYYLLITMTYIYLFRPEQGAELVGYERYIFPYYVGWFLMALALLGQAAAAGAGRRGALARLAAVGLCALLLLRVGQLVPVNYSVLGVSYHDYNDRRAFARQMEALQARLNPDGKTFLVLADDDGSWWFQYCYQLLPWQVDYSYGGGMTDRERQEDGTNREWEVTPGEWEQRLLETGCTTVYIAGADRRFMDRYGALFADGGEGWLEGEADLYRVDADGGRVRLVPIETEVAP